MKSFTSKAIAVFGLCWALICQAQAQTQNEHTADVIVYGGTSAAITSAIKAKQLGHSVIVVSPDKHLGGLMQAASVGPIRATKLSSAAYRARVLSSRLATLQRADRLDATNSRIHGNKGQGTPAIDGTQTHHVDLRIPAQLKKFLKMDQGKRNYSHSPRFASIEKVVLSLRIGAVSQYAHSVCRTFSGKMFVDATYERRSYGGGRCDRLHVGREANSKYGEKWNGIQVGILHQSTSVWRAQGRHQPVCHSR
jgi:hypothetical protein